MERDKRLYPIDVEQFSRLVASVVEASRIGNARQRWRATRPFLGMLHILRTGGTCRASTANGARSATGATAGTCGTWVRRGDHRQRDDESPPPRGRAMGILRADFSAGGTETTRRLHPSLRRRRTTAMCLGIAEMAATSFGGFWSQTTTSL